MSVNDVSDLESCHVDLPNSLQLGVELIPTEDLLLTDVGEDPVPLALADVERLAVARIDQPVDVVLQLVLYFRRKGFSVRHALEHREAAVAPTPALPALPRSAGSDACGLGEAKAHHDRLG